MGNWWEGREITLEEADTPSHLLSLASRHPTSSQSPSSLLLCVLWFPLGFHVRWAAFRVLPGCYLTLGISDHPYVADFQDDFFSPGQSVENSYLACSKHSSLVFFSQTRCVPASVSQENSTRQSIQTLELKGWQSA